MSVENSQPVDYPFPGEKIRDWLSSGDVCNLHWTWTFVHPMKFPYFTKGMLCVCMCVCTHNGIEYHTEIPQRGLRKGIPKYPLLWQCFTADLIVRRSLWGKGKNKSIRWIGLSHSYTMDNYTNKSFSWYFSFPQVFLRLSTVCSQKSHGWGLSSWTWLQDWSPILARASQANDCCHIWPNI